MTFASYVMAFGQEKWILRNLENAYPHVDQIYVCYPKLPWNYNSEARKTYKNTLDLNIITDSPYKDKITIIKGNWTEEIAQRNACLKRAKKDGVDYLMVHDADEFYFYKDFERIKEHIIANPEFDSYVTKMCTFWKSFKYVLITPIRNDSNVMLGGKVSGIAETIVNLHKDYTYESIRLTNAKNRYLIDDIIYYHAAYVLTDEEVLKKIKTWGHNPQFDPDKWYNEIWLPWTLKSKNLHPLYPELWSHCEIYNDLLPEVIEDFDFV